MKYTNACFSNRKTEHSAVMQCWPKTPIVPLQLIVNACILLYAFGCSFSYVIKWDNPYEGVRECVGKIAVYSATLPSAYHIWVTVNTTKWSSDQYCDVRRMTAAAGQWIERELPALKGQAHWWHRPGIPLRRHVLAPQSESVDPPMASTQFSGDLSADRCPRRWCIAVCRAWDLAHGFSRDYIIGGCRRLGTDCTRAVDIETVYERAVWGAPVQTSTFVGRHVAFFTRRCDQREAGRS